MYANTYCVHNVHNSTVVGIGGGVFTGFVVLFSSFSAFSIFKMLFNNRYKMKYQKHVIMLKHINLYKKGLVII